MSHAFVTVIIPFDPDAVPAVEAALDTLGNPAKRWGARGDRRHRHDPFHEHHRGSGRRERRGAPDPGGDCRRKRGRGAARDRGQAGEAALGSPAHGGRAARRNARRDAAGSRAHARAIVVVDPRPPVRRNARDDRAPHPAGARSGRARRGPARCAAAGPLAAAAAGIRAHGPVGRRRRQVGIRSRARAVPRGGTRKRGRPARAAILRRRDREQALRNTRRVAHRQGACLQPLLHVPVAAGAVVRVRHRVPVVFRQPARREMGILAVVAARSAGRGDRPDARLLPPAPPRGERCPGRSRARRSRSSPR